jgi:hypothetical protein
MEGMGLWVGSLLASALQAQVSLPPVFDLGLF